MKILKHLLLLLLFIGVANCDEESTDCSDKRNDFNNLTAAGEACQSDSDGDGICDSDEEILGTDSSQVDIFVEIDYMPADDDNPGIKITRNSLDLVRESFAAQDIALHLDVGNAISGEDKYSPDDYNYCGGNRITPYEKLSLTEAGIGNADPACSGDCISVEELMETEYESNREKYFRYAILGYSSTGTDGNAVVLGLALTPGNLFYVTNGPNLFGSTDTYLENELALTLMHELGHNLNLNHGGDVTTLGKPNYESIMNYVFGVGGVADPGSSSQYQVYLGNLDNTNDPIDFNGFCSSISYPSSGSAWNIGIDVDSQNWVLDFSHGTNNSLNESAMNESTGINGSGYDFNCDGTIGGTFAFDFKFGDDNDPSVSAVNETNETISDYDDWGNLLYDFDSIQFVKPGNSGGIVQNLTVDYKINPEQILSGKAIPRPKVIPFSKEK